MTSASPRGKCSPFVSYASDLAANALARRISFPPGGIPRNPRPSFRAGAAKSPAICRSRSPECIRGNDEFAAVPLILFEPSIMQTRARARAFPHSAVTSRARATWRRRAKAIFSQDSPLSDIGRSESLICTVRILMDPDILCPAR